MDKKKILIIVSIIFITILILTTGLLIVYLSMNSSSSPNVQNNLNNMSVSYPVSNPVISTVDTNATSSYPLSSSNLINYTHSSGKFGFKYSDNWEFLPERNNQGLRPKEYTCSDACLNEIVTVLYFENKGVDLRSQAMSYDGGYDSDWQNITLGNVAGMYYHFTSNNLDNQIYWVTNGKDAVKLMFRKFNAFPSDGHSDNSRFENDFKVILNSFHFTNN